MTMFSASSSRHNSRTSSPSSTDGSLSKPTPSPRSTHSPNSLHDIHEPESFELRAISSHNDPSANDGDGENDDMLHRARHASMESTQSYELYTPDEDKGVLRKLDRKLVAFMALLYCLSFLDRSSE